MNHNHYCPCPTDITPSNPCCPDDTDLGSAVDVRDKDCNPRRILPGTKGVLAAKSGRAGMMDGSKAKPLTMDFETFLASDGYVMIQASGGRVIAIKPDTDLAEKNAMLQFVYEGGEFKLIPIALENLFPEQFVPVTTAGKLATIACSGKSGFIKLGKFLPFSPPYPDGGPWALVIDSNNNVTASEVAVDECPPTDPADQLDTIIGCVEGKWKTVLPVKDKTLVGVETAGVVKWALKDGIGSLVEVPRVNIYSRHSSLAGWPAGGSDTGTVNVATLSGYLPEYKFIHLHFQYWGQTQNWAISNNTSIEGRKYIGFFTSNIAFCNENNQNNALVPIPASKVLNISTVTESFLAGASGLISGVHHLDISLDGWMK